MLIPAVKAFIVIVDLPARRIVVRDVPGLLPAEQEEIEPEVGDREQDAHETPDAATALSRIGKRRFGAKR